MQLEIAQQRRKPDSHVEIGVQIELIAGKYGFFGACAAADTRVAFKHGDPHAGTRQIGGKRQAVMAGADYDTIEIRHACFPKRPTQSVAVRNISNNDAEIVQTVFAILKRTAACQAAEAMIE